MLGLKANLLSEARGSRLGLGIRGYVELPIEKPDYNTPDWRRFAGVSGEINAGVDLLLAKRLWSGDAPEPDFRGMDQPLDLGPAADIARIRELAQEPDLLVHDRKGRELLHQQLSMPGATSRWDRSGLSGSAGATSWAS